MRPTCKAADCSRQAQARGFCSADYNYLHRHNDGDWSEEKSHELFQGRALRRRGRPRVIKAPCWATGCSDDEYAHGLCSRCYGHILVNGLTNAPVHVQQAALDNRRAWERMSLEDKARYGNVEEKHRAEREAARVAKYEQRIADYLAYVDRTRGTTHGYGGYCHGCRCEACREGGRLYGNYRTAMRALGRPMERRRKKAVHGTTSMYTNGCRCDPCRDAHRAYKVAWKERQKTQAEGLAARFDEFHRFSRF